MIKVHAENTGIEILHMSIELFFQTPAKLYKKMYICQKNIYWKDRSRDSSLN